MNRKIFAALALFCLALPLVFFAARGFSLCFRKNAEATAVFMPLEEATRLFPSFSSLQKPIDASEDLLSGEVPLAVSDGEIVSAAEHLAGDADTRYLLWTDLFRLETYVLEKKEGRWSLLRRLPCSVGDASNPTPEGFYHIGVHRASFGRAGYYKAVYAMQISGNYLYHSILLTENDEILDGRLGERISHGCIRHSLEDSRWLYETIPDGTSVLIR